MSNISRSRDGVPDRVPPGKIRLSIDEYLELPNDGKRYQILDGELDVTPAPTTVHQIVSHRLERLLGQHAEDRGLGLVLDAPVDVILDRHNIFQPDIVYISRERYDIITEKNIQGAPDLVVEILSESTARTDRVVKARLYARFGVAHYWIVDPEQKTVEEYVLQDNAFRQAALHTSDQTFRPTLFPDLDVSLGRLFRPLKEM